MWGSVGSSSVVVGEVPVEVVDLLLAVLELHGGVGTPSPLLLQGAKHLAMETEGAMEELVTSATIPKVVLKATGALQETHGTHDEDIAKSPDENISSDISSLKEEVEENKANLLPVLSAGKNIITIQLEEVTSNYPQKRKLP